MKRPAWRLPHRLPGRNPTTMATVAPPNDPIERLLADRPAFHAGGRSRWDSLPGTLEEIRRSVRPGDTTLETGAGASTVVFVAAGATHTAISPDAGEHERIRAYCRQAGVDDTGLRFVAGCSEDVLPALLGRERTLDFAFIDGAHAFPFPAVDWCYISRALRIGGRLLIDDITIPTVTPVFRHMLVEPNWRLERVLDDRAAVLTLIAEPAPGDWPAQRSNDRFPDFGYAPWLRRIELSGRHRLGSLARRMGGRAPALRHVYHRARGGSAR